MMLSLVSLVPGDFKEPLYGARPHVAGIAGAIYITRSQPCFQDLWPTIQHMDENYREHVSILQMTQSARMSRLPLVLVVAVKQHVILVAA